MFYASLRPLDHLFRSPYQFYSDDLSFWAYREMWNTVPMLGRYIFNSLFLATCTALITLIFVIPAAYSYARFQFPLKNFSLYLLLANLFPNPAIGTRLISDVISILLSTSLARKTSCQNLYIS